MVWILNPLLVITLLGCVQSSFVILSLQGSLYVKYRLADFTSPTNDCHETDFQLHDVTSGNILGTYRFCMSRKGGMGGGGGALTLGVVVFCSQCNSILSCDSHFHIATFPSMLIDQHLLCRTVAILHLHAGQARMHCLRCKNSNIWALLKCPEIVFLVRMHIPVPCKQLQTVPGVH